MTHETKGERIASDLTAAFLTRQLLQATSTPRTRFLLAFGTLDSSLLSVRGPDLDNGDGLMAW